MKKIFTTVLLAIVLNCLVPVIGSRCTGMTCTCATIRLKPAVIHPVVVKESLPDIHPLDILSFKLI